MTDEKRLRDETMDDLVNSLLRILREGVSPSGIDQEAAQETLLDRVGRIPDDALRTAAAHCGFESTSEVYALVAFAAHLTRCGRHESDDEECGSELRTLMTLSTNTPLIALLIDMWRTGYAEAIADLRAERLVV